MDFGLCLHSSISLKWKGYGIDQNVKPELSGLESLVLRVLTCSVSEEYGVWVIGGEQIRH